LVGQPAAVTLVGYWSLIQGWLLVTPLAGYVGRLVLVVIGYCQLLRLVNNIVTSLLLGWHYHTDIATAIG